MSIERDDLTVQARDLNDNLTGGWRYLQEGEFEQIAHAEGYVRLDPYGDLRRLRLALRKHGHEDGLRAALLEWLDGEET